MSVAEPPRSEDPRSAAGGAAAAVKLREAAFFRSVFVRSVRYVAYLLSAVVIVGLPAAWFAGVRRVTTPSVPRGIWRIYNGPVERYGFVTVCLPKDIAVYGRQAGYLESGLCPGHAESIMKRVIAMPGDRVELSQAGVRVNGRLLANSVRLTRDSFGHTVRYFATLGTTVVPTGAYWLLGINAKSWDSRYFGAVPQRGIVGIGKPIWVESVPGFDISKPGFASTR